MVDQYLHSVISVINMKPTKNGIQVLLPNKTTIKYSRSYNLKIPDLPEEATRAHISKVLVSGSLLSIG